MSGCQFTPGCPELTGRLRDAAERDGGEHLILGRLAEEGGLKSSVAEHGADGIEALYVSFKWKGVTAWMPSTAL